MLVHDKAERQVHPLLNAPRPGAQQAASLAYDSGTREAAASVLFFCRQ